MIRVRIVGTMLVIVCASALTARDDFGSLKYSSRSSSSGEARGAAKHRASVPSFGKSKPSAMEKFAQIHDRGTRDKKAGARALIGMHAQREAQERGTRDKGPRVRSERNERTERGQRSEPRARSLSGQPRSERGADIDAHMRLMAMHNKFVEMEKAKAAAQSEAVEVDEAKAEEDQQ